MDAQLTEWLGLAVRWVHVIAAIYWIGHAFFFNWLDSNLALPDPADGKRDVEGELWMVHSGGFYLVEKKQVVPERMPRLLHWFKWEAAATWLSGFCLLIVVYYMSGGVLLVDRNVSSIGVGAAIGLGIGTLIAGWALYDLIWISPLGLRPAAAGALSAALLGAVAYGLTQVLSSRAAYLHVGALLGTIMVANVWMRILPAQRALIAATVAGRAPDPALAVRAKTRSKHNNYMAFPVVFIMISNHFPITTYGHTAWGNQRSWVLLLLLVALGAGVRALMNLRKRWLIAPVVAAAAALLILTVRAPGGRAHAPRPRAQGPAADLHPIDPATTGTIRGVVRLSGDPPAPEPLSLVSACAAQHDGPVYGEAVLVHDGRLANAFVSIQGGLEGWAMPAPPAAEVVIDQKGCLYTPRVSGAQVGQPVTISNSDPLLHNVHAVAEENSSFNLAMATRGMRDTRRFDEPEVMVHLKCDVHPWMSAFIGVVPHPFFAVTGADGAFTLAGVPPGEYQLEVWHEVYGRQTRKVTVPAQGSAEVELVFAPGS